MAPSLARIVWDRSPRRLVQSELTALERMSDEQLRKHVLTMMEGASVAHPVGMQYQELSTRIEGLNKIAAELQHSEPCWQIIHEADGLLARCKGLVAPAQEHVAPPEKRRTCGLMAMTSASNAASQEEHCPLGNPGSWDLFEVGIWTWVFGNEDESKKSKALASIWPAKLQEVGAMQKQLHEKERSLKQELTRLSATQDGQTQQARDLIYNMLTASQPAVNLRAQTIIHALVKEVDPESAAVAVALGKLCQKARQQGIKLIPPGAEAEHQYHYLLRLGEQQDTPDIVRRVLADTQKGCTIVDQQMFMAADTKVPVEARATALLSLTTLARQTEAVLGPTMCAYIRRTLAASGKISALDASPKAAALDGVTNLGPEAVQVLIDALQINYCNAYHFIKSVEALKTDPLASHGRASVTALGKLARTGNSIAFEALLRFSEDETHWIIRHLTAPHLADLAKIYGGRAVLPLADMMLRAGVGSQEQETAQQCLLQVAIAEPHDSAICTHLTKHVMRYYSAESSTMAKWRAFELQVDNLRKDLPDLQKDAPHSARSKGTSRRGRDARGRGSGQAFAAANVQM